MLEREEQQAAKNAMRVTVPNLNLNKQEALMRSEDRARSQNQSVMSGSIRS